MSDGSSPKKKRARVRPAKSGGEAWGRWGLRGSPPAGMPAYTQGHVDEAGNPRGDFERDAAAGRIDAPPISHNCPRQHPDRDCPGCADPSYCSSWTYRRVRRTALGSADGKPRSVRITTQMSICFDCRMYLYWRDRQQYFRASGEDHGLGYVRPMPALRREWVRSEAEAIETTLAEREAAAELELDGLLEDPGVGDRHQQQASREVIFGDGRIRTYLEAERAAKELAKRERKDLLALAGGPLKPIRHRYEQATLLATVRRLLTAYLTARMNATATARLRAGPISSPLWEA